MPKAWPMLASALNLQLGWGAKWKVAAGWNRDGNRLQVCKFGMTLGQAKQLNAPLCVKTVQT